MKVVPTWKKFEKRWSRALPGRGPVQNSSPSLSAQTSRCHIYGEMSGLGLFLEKRGARGQTRRPDYVWISGNEVVQIRNEHTRLQVLHSVSGTQAATWRSLPSTCHTVSRYTCKYNFIYSTKRSRDFYVSTSQFVYLCTYVFMYLLIYFINIFL